MGEESMNNGTMGGIAGAISINPNATHQTLEGFGTSGCWWSQDVGTWDESVREQISQWFFDREKGIGLTIYRFNVGAGGLNEAPDPWRRVETFATEDGGFDWSRDTGSVDMLRRAVAHGADNVVFFANSPPGSMLKNGRTTGDDEGGANLSEGKEDEFAAWLVDVALHFREEGIPVRYISPINEPQWNWKLSNGQEGCHYAPNQVMTVAKALLKELDARGEGMQASLAESGKMWDAAYTLGIYTMMATDPETKGRFPHFSVHAYWSSEQDKRLLASKLEEIGNPLPLWQSEWCQMESGRDTGMGPALVLARCVHEDLTILDCTSWQTWIGVTRYDYRDGLIEVDPSTKTASAMKRLWALGNWSRFVRPGAVRIEAESPSEGLLLDAWRGTDGRITLVAANETDAEIAAGLPENKGFAAWETSDAHDLEPVFSGEGATYRFPPKSVTTLTLN